MIGVGLVVADRLATGVGEVVGLAVTPVGVGTGVRVEVAVTPGVGVGVTNAGVKA